jgi:hypothetical protein
MATAKRHPLANARPGKRGGTRVKHTGGYGRMIKKAGKKKRAKKAGKKRSKKRASTKGRVHSKRKGSRKKRASRTTIKVSGVKAKKNCPQGYATVGSFAKAKRGQTTHIVIGTRCVKL